MKICHIDAFAGVAGDMLVGALLDAGADLAALTAGLDSLATGARFRTEPVRRGGIAATKFHIEFEDQKKHRHLPHIVKMIEAAALPERARANAIRTFETLGAAEARVHGTTIEKVHFHEVGAVDSICDIVGVCLALELLGVERVTCSAINTGSGTITADHGVMPVPTPATALLLEGKPVYARGPETELTTPTGAALVATLAESCGPMPALRVTTSGFGAGTKDFPGMANVVRVLIGETSTAREATEIAVIEANLDDASPEWLGYAMERLLEAGALDVSFSPAQMKKNRPGVRLEVLALPADTDRLAALIMAETGTLGVRITAAERRVAERPVTEVDTPWGKIRVKGSVPEFEDCRRAALASGQPLREVMAAAVAAYRKAQAE